jgi:hypothetical protein
MRPNPLLAGLALAGLVAAGCRTPIVDPAVRSAPQPRPDAGPPSGNNWSVPPAQAERLLATGRIEIISLERMAEGVAGAYKAEIAFPDEGRRVRVKWKVAPSDLDGWNNNPRKELATYEVQRWFLVPSDYVVPTVVVRCVPLDTYRRVEPEATPTVEGTNCVLGTLSLWLEHVEVPDTVYDPQRFARDSTYAHHLADFNVLTYLVQHRDGRPGNILVADDATNRRVFAVDNGISFGGLVYNFLTTNWDVIRVPSIPIEVVARLRALDRRTMERTLAVLADLRADARGILRAARPGPPLDPERGVRVTPRHVQFGLTTTEIAAVIERRDALLEQVDAGTLAVF